MAVRFTPLLLPHSVLVCHTKETGRLLWSKQHNSPSNLDVTLGWTLLLKLFFSFEMLRVRCLNVCYQLFPSGDHKTHPKNKAYYCVFYAYPIFQMISGRFISRASERLRVVLSKIRFMLCCKRFILSSKQFEMKNCLVLLIWVFGRRKFSSTLFHWQKLLSLLFNHSHHQLHRSIFVWYNLMIYKG